MNKLKKRVLASITEEKIKELYAGVYYRYGGYKAKNPYDIMAKALRKHKIQIKGRDTLHGSRKAISRWLNGGLQRTLKECAKCVVANGNYQDFMSDNEMTFHHACFPNRR